MIAYFDSSSIVKWFFDESYSDQAREVRDQADAVATSIIAFPEVLSAFNRSAYDSRCDKSSLDRLVSSFTAIWQDLAQVNIDQGLLNFAGKLVFKYNLRGFDAVHLASACRLLEMNPKLTFFFSCFDQRLNLAAEKEGFQIHQGI